MAVDYYEMLGLKKGADEKEIKSAYRKLAKKYHPDMNPGDKDAEKKFKEITDAYNVLSDPEKKKMYDTYGTADFGEGFNAGDASEFFRNFGGFGGFSGASGFGGQTGSYTDGSGTTFHFEGGDMGGMFGDIFGSMFGGGRSSGFGGGSGFGGFGRKRQTRGEDYNYEMEIGFDESIYGGEKVIRYSKDGKVEALKVKIPAGIEDGKTLRLRGKGLAGANGGPAGDLLVKIKVLDKPGWERKGLDVYTTANIPFTTAVFGGEVKFHTLGKDVAFKVPAGTQSGSKIRLKGKGVKAMNSDKCGDEYVTIQISVPKKVGRAAAKALREFEKLTMDEEAFVQ